MLHEFIDNIKNETMTTETKEHLNHHVHADAKPIQSAQERLLISALQRFHESVLEIFHVSPDIKIEINKIPVSKVAFIAECNKQIELQSTTGETPWSYAVIKSKYGSIEVSSYDINQHIPI